MTFDARETSIASGQPIWLYELQRGSQTWFYTSADSDQVWSIYTYTAAAIAHDKIEATSEQASHRFVITLPATLDAVQDYRTGQPGEPMLVRVRSMHAGDTEARLELSGMVQQPGFPAGSACTLQCVTAMGELQQTGLRGVIARNCPLDLYGQGERQCNLDRNAWRVPASVTAMDATTCTAAALGTEPDGWFTGGYIEWQQGITQQRRFILGHVGSVITLMGSTVGLAVGDAISAYPGCAHTVAACTSFGNLFNYGGVIALPYRSPFDGAPVY